MPRLIQSLLVILILSTSPLYADIGPGPSPEPPRPMPLPEQGETSPAKTDPPIQSDVAPIPPVPEATSPIPMVIAGLAATAGVALLGLWIAKKGRSGNAQDQ